MCISEEEFSSFEELKRQAPGFRGLIVGPNGEVWQRTEGERKLVEASVERPDQPCLPEPPDTAIP